MLFCSSPFGSYGIGDKAGQAFAKSGRRHGAWLIVRGNKEKSEKRVERVLFPGLADFENSEDKTNAFHKERETVANTAELVENALKENPILKELAEINLNTLTPLDCMRLLFEWKEKL